MTMTLASPALQSNTMATDGCAIRVAVDSLHSEPYAVVTSGDGETIVVPGKFLAALGRQGNFLQMQGRQMLDDARRSHSRLWEDCRLMAFGIVPGEQLARTYALVREGGWDGSEGVPFLEWRSEAGGATAGWRLTLSGAQDVTVGFACWDDADAVDRLIDAMGDPESLMTVAGITSPEIIANLSARLTAVSLRSARSLPRIDLPKARKVLTDAGLAESGSGRARGSKRVATMRLLAVRVGDTKVPVAVAINPPVEPAGTPQLTEREAATLNWSQKQQRVEELRTPPRQDWAARASAALEAAGWRLVELPKPRQPWGQTRMECLWATRIDAETWSSLSAAAAREAQALEMSRGAIL